MTSISERLANLSIPSVIVIVVTLFILRTLLQRHRSHATKSIAEIIESVMIAVVLVFLIIRPFIIQAFFIPSESMLPTLNISDHILVNKFIYRFQEPRYKDIIVFKSPPEANDSQYPIDYSQWGTVIGKITSAASNGEVTAKIDRDYRKHITKLNVICVSKRGSFNDIIPIAHTSVNGETAKIAFRGVYNLDEASALVGAKLKVSEKEYIKRLIGLPGDTIEIRKYDGVYRNSIRLNEPYIAEAPNYDWGPATIPEGQLFVMGDNRTNSKDSHVWGTLSRSRVIGKAMVRFWPFNRMGILR